MKDCRKSQFDKGGIGSERSEEVESMVETLHKNLEEKFFGNPDKVFQLPNLDFNPG